MAERLELCKDLANSGDRVGRLYVCELAHVVYATPSVGYGVRIPQWACSAYGFPILTF